jgi:hypothetical protein
MAKPILTSGDASDGEVEGVLQLVLTARGVGDSEALKTAARFAQAALSARQKIAEATRYEIVITDGVT